MGRRVYDKVCGTWGGNEDRDTLRKQPNRTAPEGSHAQRPPTCLGGHPTCLQCSSSLSGSSRLTVRTTHVCTRGVPAETTSRSQGHSRAAAPQRHEAEPARLSRVVPSPLLGRKVAKTQTASSW